ncbi:hypothetical protein Y88_1501 [Novosphingobium nitrogenifigens DSM 19370]|uniref:Uncharacterized protein n=1 Tax=Novosphingobium nitrogenifigens DSM 19370 TaxID=983920 RepID=F1Z7F7_9SPHN|nr:hypothetical protein Y88_1501 [Novosphingobium nitrogenifigens DSM 19370]
MGSDHVMSFQSGGCVAATAREDLRGATASGMQIGKSQAWQPAVVWAEVVWAGPMRSARSPPDATVIANPSCPACRMSEASLGEAARQNTMRLANGRSS